MDFTVKIFGGFLINEIEGVHSQIHDIAAAVTDKMVVWRSITVKMLGSAAVRELPDRAELHQKRQVPVNGTQADVWKFFPDGLVDHVRCRMILPCHNIIYDRIALFAFINRLGCRTHFFPLISMNCQN